MSLAPPAPAAARDGRRKTCWRSSVISARTRRSIRRARKRRLTPARRIARRARWCASTRASISARRRTPSASSSATRRTPSGATFTSATPAPDSGTSAASLATIALTFATLWAARRYGLDGHLGGTWLTVRWVTGWSAWSASPRVMAYPARKQIYRRRAGPLRYWMLAHVYLGVIAGIVLLLHGGRDHGGLAHFAADGLVRSGHPVRTLRHRLLHRRPAHHDEHRGRPAADRRSARRGARSCARRWPRSISSNPELRDFIEAKGAQAFSFVLAICCASTSGARS